METTDRQGGQEGRRFKPGRGLVVAAIFVGAFLVLQLAEVVWRRFAPPPPRPAAGDLIEDGAPFPSVRIDGDRVEVEAAGDRTRISLDEDDDPEALATCIRMGIEQSLGRSADEAAGTAETPSPSRREIRDRVHDVTQRCIDEANGVLSPSPLPPPPPPAEPPGR